MPEFMRRFGGTYVRCSSTMPGAFEVSEVTAAEWANLCSQAGHGQPRDWCGRRLRPYPALDVASHAPFAPDGIYVDHRDAAVERSAYEQRDRVLRASNGERQAVLQGIADAHGLRHWRDAYNTVRNVGRRHTGEDGRDTTTGDLRWRAWTRNPWSPAGLAAVSAPAVSGFRHFGIEVEFGRSTDGGNHRIRAAIYDAMIEAGIDTLDRWGSWHRAAGISGWHCTHDSTVAGEIISDILDGSAASRDEVAAVLRIVRDNGGRPHAGQGMHVHHDVRDFTTADKVRLVDNIAACQDALLAFVGNRTHSGWCRPMTATEFAAIRRTVAAGGAGGNDHSVAWNFGHLNGRGSIEFRALGNTLNGRKVRAWIQVGQCFMAATRAGHTFTPNTSVPGMLAILRSHGLSRWASDVFATRCGHTPVAA